MKEKKFITLEKQRAILGYCFTLPSFLGFLVFVVIPVVWALVISFQKYNIFTGATSFIGTDNYKAILTEPRALQALLNTLWYAVFCTVFNTLTGLLLALAVNSEAAKRISVIFRAIYFFPSLIGLTFVAVIWQVFFQTDFGVLNYYLGKIGIPAIGWLSNQHISKIAVLILDVNLRGRPKREIVTEAQSDKLLDDFQAVCFVVFNLHAIRQERTDRTALDKLRHERHFHHFYRHPLRMDGKIVDYDFLPLPHRTISGNGVELGVDFRIAPFVLFDNLLYGLFPYRHRFMCIGLLSKATTKPQR